jgi:hypothetical protein
MLHKVYFISWRCLHTALGGPTLNSNGVNKCHATRPETLDAYLSWPLPVRSLTFLNQSLQIVFVLNITFDKMWTDVVRIILLREILVGRRSVQADDGYRLMYRERLRLEWHRVLTAFPWQPSVTATRVVMYFTEEWRLLGSYAVWLLKETTLRMNLAPPSSGWQQSLNYER